MAAILVQHYVCICNLLQGDQCLGVDEVSKLQMLTSEIILPGKLWNISPHAKDAGRPANSPRLPMAPNLLLDTTVLVLDDYSCGRGQHVRCMHVALDEYCKGLLDFFVPQFHADGVSLSCLPLPLHVPRGRRLAECGWTLHVMFKCPGSAADAAEPGHGTQYVCMYTGIIYLERLNCSLPVGWNPSSRHRMTVVTFHDGTSTGKTRIQTSYAIVVHQVWE